MHDKRGERRLGTIDAAAATASDWGIDASFEVRYVHRLRTTQRVLDAGNPVLSRAVGEAANLPAKVLFFVDDSLASNGADVLAHIESYAAAHSDVMRLAGPTRTVPGGECCKNEPEVLDAVMHAIDEAGLCRQSFVIAIGGGAVLDAVGYAAAIAHRGVRLIRVPSTTLSQADSGVGVKNGVNYLDKKNYTGTFVVPWAVINDEALLDSLSERDWRCGFSEAVKVALLKDAELYESIEAGRERIRQRDRAAAVPVLRRAAELHLRHITGGGDPFETRTARPLDFGHWAAHKLEQMTAFELRHGEAVAIGLALDLVYASRVGLLERTTAERILDCLAGLGFELFDEAMRDSARLLEGIEEFRQHLGGQLTVTLISAIGRPVDVHEMDASRIEEAIEYLADRAAAVRG
jgi:3-dehydroquinate synthase